MTILLSRPNLSALTLIIALGLAAVGCRDLSAPLDEESAPNQAFSSVLGGDGPSLSIFRPPYNGDEPAVITPVYVFHWGPRGGFEDPADVRRILVRMKRFKENWDAALDYVRFHPKAREWSDWVQYEGRRGELWMSPELDAGEYVFAVQGRDNEGNASTEFDFEWNARKILVDPGAGGPLLEVTNEYMAPVVTTSKFTTTTILAIPFGIPLDFCWTADATKYAGTVTAYRYGWDVLDVNNPDKWDIDFTPYDGSRICAPTRTFYFGTHTFSVEVADDRGGHSWAHITVNVLPDIVTFDFMPGTCKDPINRNRKGFIKAAIPGTAGMDVRDIDASTVALYLYDFNERLSSINVRLLDITSPVIPWDECDCESKADGIDDLLLTFRAEDVVQLFNEVAPNQKVSVSLWGVFNNGQPFEGFDCVEIVGDGRTAGESLLLPVQSNDRGSSVPTR